MYDDFNQFLEKLGPDPISRFFVQLLYRKGGDGLNWATPGTVSYVPTNSIMQIGAFHKVFSGTSGSFNVTYRNAYIGIPLVFATVIDQNPSTAMFVIWVEPADNQFTVHWKADASMSSCSVAWLSVGGRLEGSSP